MGRLYRNKRTGRIGGVCAGLAYHFNIDVAIVRAAFLLLLFTGWGLLTYLALWVVTPALTYKK